MKQRIGQRAKKIRIDKGIKANHVCRKLGYKSPSSLTDIENGRRRLDADKIPLLAEALGVSVEELFSDKKNRGSRTIA